MNQQEEIKALRQQVIHLEMLLRAHQPDQTTNKQENQARATFLANMSHELRTPLNAIIGYTELLHEELGDLDDGRVYQKDLNHILSAALTLKTLIDDVVNLTKLESGNMTMRFGVCVIEKLVNDLIKKTTPMLNDDVQLVTMIDPDVPELIFTDAIKLKQALLNILSNAAKFTTHGHIKLSILSPEDNQVYFEVMDTGIGIEPSLQERLFEPFTQQQEHKKQGTGLGLAIARSLIKGLAGELEFKSQLRMGSRFFFTIPETHSET